MAKAKKVLTYIFVCLLMAMSGVTASAADRNLPDGFLIGDENGISVNEDGEYFIYEVGLEKSDRITRTLTARNLEQSGSYKLYMTAEPLEVSGRTDLLNNMLLRISMEGKLLYEGRIRGDGEGTYSFDGCGFDMINDKLELGSYSPGGSRNIDVEILMDAEHIGNWTFGYSVAEVKWIFTAVKDADSTPPKTGEILRYGLYILLAVIFTVSVIVFIRYRKLRGTCPR